MRSMSSSASSRRPTVASAATVQNEHATNAPSSFSMPL